MRNDLTVNSLERCGWSWFFSGDLVGPQLLDVVWCSAAVVVVAM